MNKTKYRTLLSSLLVVCSILSTAYAQSGNDVKFFFNTVPFTTTSVGSKQQFKSSEFIYGRIELPLPVEEFFKLPKISKTEYPVSYLIYKIAISKEGEELTSYDAAWPYAKVTEKERKNKYLNFDVLPKPAEATTMTSGVTEFDAGIGTAPLYSLFDRTNFPASGNYRIGIQISGCTYDLYDRTRILPENEWITSSGKFTLSFNVQDISTLQDNGSEASSLVKENARLKGIEARGLPEQWSMKSAPITSGFTEKELIAMFLAKEESTTTCLKAYIYPVTGPAWNIEKNDIGLPVQKWHTQTLGFFAQNKGRCFYIVGGLRQEYQGGGTYGKTYYQWEKSDEVNCKYIPKTSVPAK
jgi:hypothetical protein